MPADQALQVGLWRRICLALADRGLPIDGSPGEIAARAQSALGTYLVGRFLNDYFNERQYGGGGGKISDEAAEALVREIEKLPSRPATPVVATAAAPKNAQPLAAAAATVSSPTPSRADLEEAEAYGEDEGSTFSLVESVRRFLLDLQSNRAARHAESQRRRREKAEADRLRKLASERAEAERKQLDLEAQARARQSAAERTVAEGRDRQAAAERQREAEKRGKLQAEEDERNRQIARKRELDDLAARANQQGASGNPRRAAILLEQLVALEPTEAAGWFSLAWYYSREGNYKQSTQCYEKGVALEPTNKIAWNNLGRDLRRRRRFDRSVAALRRALELDGDYATAWANLGATLRERRDFKGAAEAFVRATGLAPNDGAEWYWLGVCQWQLRQYEAAAGTLHRTTELLPDNQDAWLRLADSLNRIGRKAEGREAQARANALAPAEAKLGWDSALLALVTLASSYGAFATDMPALGLVSAATFAFLAWRLQPSLAQIFFIAVPALPILALPFANTGEDAPIATAVLLVWVAIVRRLR